MLNIRVDREKHDIACAGDLELIAAELLHAVGILYNKLRPGSPAAKGFKTIMQHGTEDTSPIWNADPKIMPAETVMIVNPLGKGGKGND